MADFSLLSVTYLSKPHFSRTFPILNLQLDFHSVRFVICKPPPRPHVGETHEPSQNRAWVKIWKMGNLKEKCMQNRGFEGQTTNRKNVYFWSVQKNPTLLKALGFSPT